MAILLNDEEAARVNNNRKEDKPEYFSSRDGVKVPISDDFEAFLILADQDLKTTTVQWIQNSVAPSNDLNVDRKNLLQEALDAEINNAQNTMDEIDQELSDFNNFRDKYSNNKFSSVPEVGLVLNDLQVSVDELLSNRDRAKHLLCMSTVLKGNTEGAVSPTLGTSTTAVSDNQKKQTESWQEVYISYYGGSG